MVDVEFGGKVFEFEAGVEILDVLKKVGAETENLCCVKLNGDVKDFRDEIFEDCKLEVLTFSSLEGRKTYWHTTAHILAQAVKRLYGDVKLGIGPAIENGFYYDFELSKTLTPDDFLEIENEMKKIVEENLSIEREFVFLDEAKKIMEELNQPYKLELIEDISKTGSKLSFYRQGEFVDFCAGPHLASTGEVGAFKLLSVTGAYFKGNCENRMLQRIYGVSFPKKSELCEYIEMVEQAKLRDHRKLGKELELFCFEKEAPGFVFFLPNGMTIKNVLVDYWRRIHLKAGYFEISTPTILSRALWEQSGHWAHYKENMYTTKIDDDDFAIKPMNCPGAILVYKLCGHSYKEFPLRFCELGVVHRHELSGTLHGLMRARNFTQDDAHIFLTEDEIKDEVKEIIGLIDQVYGKFNFSYFLELSTMPQSHIGDISDWEKATQSLKEAVTEAGLSYKINEGDGAFYGPKIDFHLKDCLGRSWQCGTIQLDFQLPKAFELEYVGADGKKHRPIMIHRVIYGSIERFIGILIEHFFGAFPFWLAPVQIIVLPISQQYEKYAKTVEAGLSAAGFRTKIDLRNEKIGYRLREAQLKKIPFTVIVGEKEEKEKNVSVRRFGQKSTEIYNIDELISKLKVEQI